MNTLDIRKIRKSLKITQDELAKKLGVHYKTIQNWEKGGAIPESKRALIRSLGILPSDAISEYDLLPDHLNSGKMLAKEEEVEYVTSNTVYLLPFSARPLEISMRHFRQLGSTYEKVLSPVKGADFATVLSDDGLGPEFPDGSTVFFKHIDPALFIEWGKVHAISTKNGLIIKRLNPGNQPNGILCSCSDTRFQSFEIPGNSPDMHFYKAVACISVK